MAGAVTHAFAEAGVASPRLHHIGIVVGDLETAMARYAPLGFIPGEIVAIPEQHIRAVAFPAGPGWVELIQPTDPEGPIARFLAKRGEGMHHVAYAVDDLDRALRRLAAAGARLIDEAPRVGMHDWRIAFIHPESCAGVLTELVDAASLE
jgi:methylmalonyl-CoA/ethylmalonyl-CoA epimerase